MGENLPPNIKFWLDSPDHDCFFLVGPKSGPTERIGAFKLFLKGHSEPMRAMFGEGKIAELGDVRIVDVEPETFRTFLKCIYGGSDIIIPKLTFEESAKLLYIAEKYLVSDIKSKTVDRLSELLTPNNIFLAVSHKVCLQKDTLMNSVLNILQNNSKEIISNQQFFNLGDNDLLWILQQEYLNVRETEIWSAVLEWARRKCSNGENLRAKMVQFLRHIRFLTMDLKEFCRDVIPSDVLSNEEITDVCKSFGTGVPPSMSNICRNTNHRNGFAISKRLLTTHLETSPNTMSIFCSVKNVSTLQPSDTSKSFNWSGYYWSTVVLKTIEDGKDCLKIGYYCRKVGNYSVRVRNEIILLNRKIHKSNKSSSTHLHKQGQTGYVTINRLGQLTHFGFIYDDSLSFIVHLEL